MMFLLPKSAAIILSKCIGDPEDKFSSIIQFIPDLKSARSVREVILKIKDKKSPSALLSSVSRILDLIATNEFYKIGTQAVNIYPTASSAANLSQNKLLLWVNECLQSHFTRIEQLHTGAGYCLFTDFLFPKSIQLKKVTWNSRLEADWKSNWNLLVTTWKILGVEKVIPVDKLIKGKFQDNFKFLQWFKKLFDENYDGHDYDPLSARNGEDLPTSDGPSGDTKEGMSTSEYENCDSVTGQTVVDPKVYLTDLQSIIPQMGGDLQDIKKARMLLKSDRESNPRHPPAWVASAVLEEQAGELQTARNLIMEGCEKIKNSEELWLLAIRLNPADVGKAIVANAIRSCPQSVRLWCKASDLEQDIKDKKEVLREALEQIPSSVKLWKAAVELEDPEDARILLTRAVECCSSSTELWLALARLETYDNARRVLNKACVHIPTDRHIWLTAARLEETRGQKDMVDKIVSKALNSLRTNQVEINRDQWLKDAIDAENAKCPITCQAIIRNVIGLGVEDEDKWTTWLSDAKNFEKENAFTCVRAVYAVALKEFPRKKSAWDSTIDFEKEHGSLEDHEAILLKACETVPEVENYWLMLAKLRFINKRIDEARQTLKDAQSKHDHQSEKMWLAAIKIEIETDQFDRARALFAEAREKAPSARLWMKNARFEWCLGNLEEAKQLCEECIQQYDSFYKIYLVLGQVLEQMNEVQEARLAYTSGIRNCPGVIPLWIHLVRLRLKASQLKEARADLEEAHRRIPKNEDLWLESVSIDQRVGRPKKAKERMSRALQECEGSGKLWAEAIWMELPRRRISKLTLACTSCVTNPYVFIAGAKLYWSERKIEKARKWFVNAVNFHRDNGDVFANFLAFEQIHGKDEDRKAVIKDCVTSKPRYGDLWQGVAKDSVNWRKSTKEILLLTTNKIEVPT